MANISRGYCGVLGVLPASMMHDLYDSLVNVLSKAVLVQAVVDERDPETRRNALQAITSAAIAFGNAFPKGECDYFCFHFYFYLI